MINHQIQKYAIFFDKATCYMNKTWDALALAIPQDGLILYNSWIL